MKRIVKEKKHNNNIKLMSIGTLPLLAVLTYTLSSLEFYILVGIAALLIIQTIISICLLAKISKKAKKSENKDETVTTETAVTVADENAEKIDQNENSLLKAVEELKVSDKNNSEKIDKILQILGAMKNNTVVKDQNIVIPQQIESDDEDGEEIAFGGVDESGLAVVIRYNKSFTAKLIQADDDTKKYYELIKNAVLSYKNVKNRISYQHETFNKGRTKLVKLAIRGKTLCVYLALQPQTFEDTKYKVESVADVKKHVETPCLYRIKNERRAHYVLELISSLMAQNEIVGDEVQTVNYVEQFPYEPTAALIEKGLIKETVTKEQYDTFIAKLNKDKKQEESPKQDANDDSNKASKKTNTEKTEIEKVKESKPKTEKVEDNKETVTKEKGKRGRPKKVQEPQPVVVVDRVPFKTNLENLTEENKERYETIKAKLMSFTSVAVVENLTAENYNYSRQTLAKMTFEKGILKLHLALDPSAKEYNEGNYPHEDLSSSLNFVKTPFTVAIKSNVAVSRAQKLIDAMMNDNGILVKTK